MSQGLPLYYTLQPGTSVAQVIGLWRIHGSKAYDASMPIWYAAEELWKWREFTRTRGGDDWTPAEEWDALVESLKAKGWNVNDPLIMEVGRDGKAKVAEGNHRLAIARQLKIAVPVRFLFAPKVVKTRLARERAAKKAAKATGVVIDLEALGIVVHPRYEWPGVGLSYATHEVQIPSGEKLHTTQTKVSRELVEAKKASLRSGNKEPVEVFKYQGEWWIVDGHHAIAAARLLGRTVRAGQHTGGPYVVEAPRFRPKRKATPTGAVATALEDGIMDMLGVPGRKTNPAHMKRTVPSSAVLAALHSGLNTDVQIARALVPDPMFLDATLDSVKKKLADLKKANLVEKIGKVWRLTTAGKVYAFARRAAR